MPARISMQPTSADLHEHKAGIFASRLRRGLEDRFKPHGPVTLLGLSKLSGHARNSIRGWMTGQRGFSLDELLRLDTSCAAMGAPGLYAEVTALEPGRWESERLPLDALQDKRRGAFLKAWRAGGDPLEIAGALGLLPHATVLARRGGDFVSVHVGSALRIDRGVLGRVLLDRADRDYAGLVNAQMQTTRGEPTLYRMTGPSLHYTRLAVPGAELVMTLPFNESSPKDFKVR